MIEVKFEDEPKVDLTTWNFEETPDESVDDLSQKIATLVQEFLSAKAPEMKAVSETIDEVLRKDTRVWLQCDSGANPEIGLSIPLGEGDASDLMTAVSLTEVVDDFLSDDDWVEDPERVREMARVFRRFADLLEAEANKREEG